MIPRNISPQTLAIEDAETAIRRTVQKGYLLGKSKAAIRNEVALIIKSAVKQIKSSEFQRDAIKSLNAFASRLFREFVFRLGFNGKDVMLAIKAYAQGAGPRPAVFDISIEEKGIPLQEYNKDYIAKVFKTIRDIADITALDPNDVRGLNSLHNLAEMQVRYEAQQDKIAELRAKGVKFVYCSVHADCSDRCFPWQGRIYSLDGTSGTTPDGRSYVPIETATDIYTTTQSGKVYKNGLLGFNCRHDLYEYVNNVHIPIISKEMQKKESAINTRQRELERQVRFHRERALMFHSVDRAQFSKERKAAIAANKEYMRFSHENGRAYYPDRIKVLKTA
jgi:Phage minor capsid protein 2.